MKIYLPWKREGHDGRTHQATLEFTYGHSQHEDVENAYRSRLLAERTLLQKNLEEKKLKSGLRKCLEHKPYKGAIYDDKGQCSICKGYLKP